MQILCECGICGGQYLSNNLLNQDRNFASRAGTHSPRQYAFMSSLLIYHVLGQETKAVWLNGSRHKFSIVSFGNIWVNPRWKWRGTTFWANFLPRETPCDIGLGGPGGPSPCLYSSWISAYSEVDPFTLVAAHIQVRPLFLSLSMKKEIEALGKTDAATSFLSFDSTINLIKLVRNNVSIMVGQYLY